MTETLSQKRCRFTIGIAQLIEWARSEGIIVALDQVKRMQSEADANAASGAGIRNSLHLLGLAADLLIYKDGVYLPDGEEYFKLGRYWKTLAADFCHGGDFAKKDPGHFSLTHQGIK